MDRPCRNRGEGGKWQDLYHRGKLWRCLRAEQLSFGRFPDLWIWDSESILGVRSAKSGNRYVVP